MRDKRIIRLKSDHGYYGYGVYMAIREHLAMDGDHYLDNDIGFVCCLLGERGRKARAVVGDILYKYDLFVVTEDGREFTSIDFVGDAPEALDIDPILDEEEELELVETSETDTANDTLEPQKPKYTLSPQALEQRRMARKQRKQRNSDNENNEIPINRNEISITEQRNFDNENNEIPINRNEIPINRNEISIDRNEIPITGQRNSDNSVDFGGEYKGGASCCLESLGDNNSRAINEEKEAQENFLDKGGVGEKGGEATLEQAHEASPSEDAPTKPKRERKTFTPPSLEEVEARCCEMDYPQGTAERFYDYQEAVGWRVGRKPMKSWHNALAYWVRRGTSSTATATTASPSIRPTTTTSPTAEAMRPIFDAYYRERTSLSFCWSSREYTALEELSGKIQTAMQEQAMLISPQSVADSFRLFLGVISDPWILKNLSPHILNTKYNEIRSTYASCARGTAVSGGGSSPLRDLIKSANAVLYGT